jgi:sn-glycerol 3-phosphate transport system permease protein
VTSVFVDDSARLTTLSSMASAGQRARARWLPAAALLAPSLVFLIAFTYWPIARVLGESFVVGRFADHQIGLGNYQRLFADPHFSRAAWNNIAYAIGTIAPSLCLALLFALALRETTRLTAILRTLVVMPLLIPLVAAAALFSFILLPGEGLLDFYLARFGLEWLIGSAIRTWRSAR